MKNTKEQLFMLRSYQYYIRFRVKAIILRFLHDMNKIQQFSKHYRGFFKWIGKVNIKKPGWTTFKVSLLKIYNYESFATYRLGFFARSGLLIKCLS